MTDKPKPTPAHEAEASEWLNEHMHLYSEDIVTSLAQALADAERRGMERAAGIAEKWNVGFSTWAPAREGIAQAIRSAP